MASLLPTIAAHTWLVVPCYDEAARLRRDDFLNFVRDYRGVALLCVNDGSRDATLEVLHALAADAEGAIGVLDLAQNGGKAEAVRAGFLEALKAGPQFIGYWDADLATPLREAPGFISHLQGDAQAQMVLGARVQLLGRHIRRKLSRHYIGRAFATCASFYLGLRIYDTQCGAKLFRVTPTLREIFAEKWIARWLFDVELLVRYLCRVRGREAELGPHFGIYEVPLETWEDVGGSKVKAIDFPKAWLELARIMMHYGRPLSGRGPL